MYTINEAAEVLGLTPFYVRKCIRENKLPSTLVQVGETKVHRHEISEEDVELFSKRPRRQVGKREDGRNKFVIYLSPSEIEGFESLIESEDYAHTFNRANPPKS